MPRTVRGTKERSRAFATNEQHASQSEQPRIRTHGVLAVMGRGRTTTHEERRTCLYPNHQMDGQYTGTEARLKSEKVVLDHSSIAFDLPASFDSAYLEPVSFWGTW